MSKIISYRDFSKFDCERAARETSQINWDEVMPMNDVAYI